MIVQSFCLIVSGHRVKILGPCGFDVSLCFLAKRYSQAGLLVLRLCPSLLVLALFVPRYLQAGVLVSTLCPSLHLSKILGHF